PVRASAAASASGIRGRFMTQYLAAYVGLSMAPPRRWTDLLALGVRNGAGAHVDDGEAVRIDPAPPGGGVESPRQRFAGQEQGPGDVVLANRSVERLHVAARDPEVTLEIGVAVHVGSAVDERLHAPEDQIAAEVVGIDQRLGRET